MYKQNYVVCEVIRRNNNNSSVNETKAFYVHDFKNRYSNANVGTFAFSKYMRLTCK